MRFLCLTTDSPSPLHSKQFWLIWKVFSVVCSTPHVYFPCSSHLEEPFHETPALADKHTAQRRTHLPTNVHTKNKLYIWAKCLSLIHISEPTRRYAISYEWTEPNPLFYMFNNNSSASFIEHSLKPWGSHQCSICFLQSILILGPH